MDKDFLFNFGQVVYFKGANHDLRYEPIKHVVVAQLKWRDAPGLDYQNMYYLENQLGGRILSQEFQLTSECPPVDDTWVQEQARLAKLYTSSVSHVPH